MKMTRLALDLPDDVARDLEAQAHDAGKTREEYAAGLFAAARSARQRLEALLVEGLDSGPGKEITTEYLESLDRRLKEIVKSKRQEVRAKRAS